MWPRIWLGGIVPVVGLDEFLGCAETLMLVFQSHVVFRGIVIM